MSTRAYTLPIEMTEWRIPGHGSEVVFDWDYEDTRERLLNLYERGKEKQWNATTRIDWSVPVDPADQGAMPDYQVPLFGSDIWERMSRADKDQTRLHMLSWMFSQFLHGEQGALVCTAKIVEAVPDIDAKFYGATQVIDEARHVEVYKRFLFEKLGLAYPINPSLASLLDQTITDSRWDFTYLGMQMMIEGVALAAFGMIRDVTESPLPKALNAYVMSDEARHVAFGTMVLQDAYKDMTQAEKDEREAFVVEASYLLRDRFLAREVWERLDLPVADCMEYVDRSQIMSLFRKNLFSRVVPNIKKIGLWGPNVQNAFVDLGVIDFQDLDTEEAFANDESVAEALDRPNHQDPNSSTQSRASEIAEVIHTATQP